MGIKWIRSAATDARWHAAEKIAYSVWEQAICGRMLIPIELDTEILANLCNRCENILKKRLQNEHPSPK